MKVMGGTGFGHDGVAEKGECVRALDLGRYRRRLRLAQA